MQNSVVQFSALFPHLPGEWRGPRGTRASETASRGETEELPPEGPGPGPSHWDVAQSRTDVHCLNPRGSEACLCLGTSGIYFVWWISGPGMKKSSSGLHFPTYSAVSAEHLTPCVCRIFPGEFTLRVPLSPHEASGPGRKLMTLSGEGSGRELRKGILTEDRAGRVQEHTTETDCRPKATPASRQLYLQARESS